MSRTLYSFAVVAGLAFVAANASADIVRARVLARIGDPLGTSTISSLDNPFVDGNSRVGFIAALADSTRSIWYDGAQVFNSASALPDVLTGSEGTIGVSNTGGFIYSPSFNGDDAVYTNNGVLLVDGDPAPGRPGEFASFNSRPGMLADGTAVWVAGWSTTIGGATVGRILYRCADTTDVTTSTIVFQSGDVIGGVAPLTASGVGFTYDFSDNGAHHIHRLILDTGSTATNDVVYLDGAIAAREGDVVPGGVGGETWVTFNAIGVNNGGDSVFSSNTSGATTSDEILVRNGAILYREGGAIDGVTLASTVDLANVNNRGWIAFIWDSSATIETLFAANPAAAGAAAALLRTNDELDVDGDGVGDFVINDFNASTAITNDGGFAENGYFYASIDMTPVGGGTAAEAVIGVSVLAGCPGDLDFDFDVDLGDLATMLANFGTASGAGPVAGDLDLDGDVDDLSDLAALLAAFGTTC